MNAHDIEAAPPLAATVPASAAGRRFDAVLAELFPQYSRSRLAEWIKSGDALLDGQQARPRDPVRGGEAVSLAVVEDVQTHAVAEDIPLDILYEDGSVLVIDKPAGLVVHPGAGNPAGTLVNALLAHCGDGLSGIGGVRRPGIVHRLDKDTSGLIVAAKTEVAHHALVAQFQARSIERRYLALAWGVPRARQGRIEGDIGRDPRNRKKMAVLGRGGRPAVTHYEVVEAFDATAALLRCRLETGRTHQIRVHLAHIGHPVLGDGKYGGSEAFLPTDEVAKQLHLHAREIHLPHPTRHGFIHVTADLPPHMRDTWTMFDFSSDFPGDPFEEIE